MSNSYRVRTEVGVDKSINILLDQDFEFLEILSLKLLQSQIYTRQCSDYGVVVGRVVTNGGFGIPNAKVSIFIPLTSEDENNPIISELYPYKSLTDTNEDGYRYNLLPYTKSYSEHVPTGTFFSREDVLTNPAIIEVFDKYYRYTARTNDSGDFMIFGVPVGSQTIHMDVDLSDIGEFSLSPQDLIRIGKANSGQVGGTKFKSSTNLGSLPQIVSINRVIQVEPLWGQPEVCNLGITRTDFDLTEEFNITISPTAIFMGSIFSDLETLSLRKNCKPKFKQGELCNLVTGPGQILSIRQTIFNDNQGRPILENFELENGGQAIDEDGTWVIDVPMNMDYVITNEFGERVLSDDPKKGIPTTAKYRFKVKWNQSPSLSENIKRGYFLVPNIREYGWDSTGGSYDPILRLKSYSFSLDWNDYADINSSINCDDTFYPMVYNKVYTVSQLIDRFRGGSLPNRTVTVKNILDDKCESETNKFPTNDSVYRSDIIFLLFSLLMLVFRILAVPLLVIIHVVFFIVDLIKNFGNILGAAFILIAGYLIVASISIFAQVVIPPFGVNLPALAEAAQVVLQSVAFASLGVAMFKIKKKLDEVGIKKINLPLMMYDQCEFCDLEEPPQTDVPNITPSSDLVPTGFPGDLDTTLLKITDFSLGEFVSSPDLNLQHVNNLLSGYQISSPPSCVTRVPDIFLGSVSTNDYYYFTSSLTLAERINLFNTKSKYFENSPSNPGGGVNQIKVRIEPTLNPDPNDYHTDNIISLMMDETSLGEITPGMILSFQDPSKSQDKNLTGSTYNQYSNNAVTGTSLNNTSITINYTKPNGLNSSVVYQIPTPNPNDTNFSKYPSDIEYYQVITAMTYSNYISQCSSSLDNSLSDRFLNNAMWINRIQKDTNPPDNNCATNSYSVTPINYLNDYQSQVIVFLVRGVDPYSSRVNIEYDLSKIFGYSTFGTTKVSGNYKLNIPINGGFKNISHDISNNTDVDTYSNMTLYYDSFNYQPSTFIPFNSNLPKYYSSLDNKNSLYTPSCSCLVSVSTGSETSPQGLRVNINNHFTREWNDVEVLSASSSCEYYKFEFNDIVYTPNQNRGYYINEVVEGGSLMMMDATIPYPPSPLNPVVYDGYMSPIYDTTINMSFNGGISGRQIIMRSDRLPTSTGVLDNCDNSFLLQQNNKFTFYEISDSGYIKDQSTPQMPSMSVGPPDGDTTDSINNEVVQSLNDCSKSVPLKCYEYVNGEFVVRHGDCEKYDGEVIFRNGNYLLVTKPFISLVNDIRLVTEWTSRINITFGACRNIFSHIFTNNWVNGSLYAFSFKNERFFDENNQPYSDYCDNVIYYNQQDRNFYYRSSPYYSGSSEQYFVGESSINGGNDRNLKYPTTLMDLGPRSNFLQEIVFSDEYDGYVINKMGTTTFGDVSDIMNIFVLSRLANTSIISQMIGGANILRFFSRDNKSVDADYAQMISINSELGVNEFDSSNYPSNPTGQDPVYFNNGNSSEGIFGIFFSSDTTTRDFLSPKRDIIDPDTTISDSCGFNYLPNFSQEVPFYQWEIKKNPDYDSIFGSQKNEWYTNKISYKFLSNKYQSMDRLNIMSRYFRGSGSLSQYYKGYIYSVDPSTGQLNPNANSQSGNDPLPRVISVGAPYHFYFGLKKGRSAFDKFYRKWINSDIIID